MRLFLLLLLAGCASITAPEETCFDYEGSANWDLSDSTITLNQMTGDLIGTLTGAIDSSGQVQANLQVDSLRAPLMQNAFYWRGEVALTGQLKRQGEDFELILVAPKDTLELYWQKGDERIYLTGSACR